MLFVLEYWYAWVIGLAVFPVIAVLPQLKNVLRAIDRQDKDPKEIAKLFLSPGSLIPGIIGATGAFVCFMFFFLSILLAIIGYIKS